MHGTLLQDIGFCIVTAAAMSYIARLARQPLLLAYIAAGVLIGPLGLERVTDPESIRTLAELGLAFLLFIVGLEIDLKKLVASGRVALIASAVQAIGSAALAGGVAAWLGYGGLSAAYIGAAIAFSSTLIVVKLLSDRSELDTVAGRTTLAILLLQDVLAIVVLAIQPNVGSGAEGASPLAAMGMSVVKGLALVGAALLAGRFVLPPLFRWVATFPEIVLISAVSWCFLVCDAAMRAGFSSAMGALIAGVSISAFPYTLDVAARIRTLRDFFVTLFFVSLGLLLVVPTPRLLGAAVVLSVLVIASRFLTILPTLRLLGYDNRVGLLSSIHLSQTSEFGLVILLIGAAAPYHHVTEDVVSLVVMILLITAIVSTYLVQSGHRLTALLVRHAAGTFLEDAHAKASRGEGTRAPIVLVGCFRVASSVVRELMARGLPFKVIDFNPHMNRELQALGVPCTYGDISHLDTLEHAGAGEARVLVSSIPDDFLRGTSNRKLLEGFRRLNPRAATIVTAESAAQALELYAAGADYVLVPRLMAADRLVEVLEAALSGSLDAIRAREHERLSERIPDPT